MGKYAPRNGKIKMFDIFTARGKKGRFRVDCTIHGLSGIPYLSGFYFARWKAKGGRFAAGSTSSASVKGHSVSWNHPFSEEICLYLSKSEKIAPSPLRIEFRQLATGMKRSELIGKVSIELSDYIGAETTPRQYLLSASRVNSMAIITLTLSPVEGDEQSSYIADLHERRIRARSPPSAPTTNFNAPPSATKYHFPQGEAELALNRTSFSARLAKNDAEFVEGLFVSSNV